jgi:hypothetical protein
MAHPKTSYSTLPPVAREARFVFTGIIEQLGGSSLFFVPPGGSTAVVRVERIHYSATALRSQEGQQVTVILAGESRLEPGRRLVFHTNPALYGETMAVREVRSSEEIVRVPAELHERIQRMNSDAEIEHLRAHIASADVVLHGHVAATKAPPDRDLARMSEHDPDWHIALIQVERVLKGESKEKGEGEVAVRYPKSRDIRWYRVPKLEAGQESVFILHRDGDKLAILHPEDVLPGDAENVHRIAELAGVKDRK